MKPVYRKMLAGMKKNEKKSPPKRGEKWFVYMLKCSDQSLYTGITNNLEKRFKAHSAGKGARYTRTRLPLKFVYQETCRTRTDAMVRECAVKALPRKRKLSLAKQFSKPASIRTRKTPKGIIGNIKNLNELEREGQRIKGRWELDDHHRLSYRKDGDEEVLQFETDFVAAESQALVLSLTEHQENGRSTTSLARLTGRWRANESNQIEFEIERESGLSDILTFRGVWKIGKSQEIVYSHRRTAFKKRTSLLETLTFTGWWDITESGRLVYTLEGSSDSSFRFRGALQTPSILAKKGAIRYQLGVEAGGKETLRTLTLFGKWKLSNQLAVSFEMEYAGGRKRDIHFGVELALKRGLTVSAQLYSTKGTPLGVEVVLTKDVLARQAQGFMRVKAALEEYALEAGIAIPW